MKNDNNIDRIRSKADYVRTLDSIEKHTILFVIASKMVAAQKYYTYTNMSTGRKVFIEK